MRRIEPVFVSNTRGAETATHKRCSVMPILTNPIVVQSDTERGDLRTVIYAGMDEAALHEKQVQPIGYKAIGCSRQVHRLQAQHAFDNRIAALSPADQPDVIACNMRDAQILDLNYC